MTWIGLALLGLFLGTGIALRGRFLATAGVEAATVVAAALLEAGERSAEARRYAAKCAVGIVRRKEPPDEVRSKAPEMDRFVQWVEANVQPGPKQDDFIGCYEILLGLRPAPAEKREQVVRRLQAHGAPMPEQFMQRLPQ